MKNKKLGGRKTVLQVVSVSASSGHNSQTSDVQAFEALQEAGFVELKYAANKTTAFPPKGDAVFLLEYDASSPANQKPFKLVRLESGAYAMIETGYTFYIQDHSGGVPTTPLKSVQKAIFSLVGSSFAKLQA